MVFRRSVAREAVEVASEVRTRAIRRRQLVNAINPIDVAATDRPKLMLPTTMTRIPKTSLNL